MKKIHKHNSVYHPLTISSSFKELARPLENYLKQLLIQERGKKNPNQSLSQHALECVHGTQMTKWTWPLESQALQQRNR